MSAAPRPRKRRPTTRAKPAGTGAKKSGGKPTGRTVRKPAGKPVRKARPAPRTPVAAERAPRVEVRFEVPRAALPMSAAKMRALIVRAVELTGYAGRLSVAVVGDAAMHVLNLDFHDCDEPTDVLAFALERPDGVSSTDAFDGEVVLSIDTARLEATERGVTLAAEVLLYVVHGTLHLMGEDDHKVISYRRMHARALSILAALGEANTIDPPHMKLRQGRRP